MDPTHTPGSLRAAVQMHAARHVGAKSLQESSQLHVADIVTITSGVRRALPIWSIRVQGITIDDSLSRKYYPARKIRGVRKGIC
jgi:hypothetical protein